MIDPGSDFNIKKWIQYGKKTILFLILANLLLLSAGWIMAFYAYPRLPAKIPLWVNFFGQPIMKTSRSPFFFIYPIAQTGFYLVFWRLSKIKVFRKSSFDVSDVRFTLYARLKREYVYLVLIFFNLIFIHLQRSIILLAHGLERGIREYYFCLLFGIILILIPYYRLRKRLILKKLEIIRDKNRHKSPSGIF